MSDAQGCVQTPKRKNLNDVKRSSAIAELIKSSNKGILFKDDLSRVAELFGSKRWTIAGLWKEHQRQKAAGVVCPNLHNKRRGMCDQQGINVDSLSEALKNIPIKNRTTPLGVSTALGIPKTTTL